jgi:transcriptional regulator with XRE-family HTH domain
MSILFRYDTVMDVNERIRYVARQAVAEKGMTQEELAKLAGIKQATVSRLLTGRLGKPGTWEQLLDALGLELVAVPKGTDLGKLDQGKGK